MITVSLCFLLLLGDTSALCTLTRFMIFLDHLHVNSTAISSLQDRPHSLVLLNSNTNVTITMIHVTERVELDWPYIEPLDVVQVH